MPSFYIVLQESIPGIDGISLEGRALSQHSDELQELAQKAGVQPLTSFFSVDKEDIWGLIGEDSERVGIQVPEQRWFAAEDGLRTVKALLAAVATLPSALREKLTSELTEFQRVLGAAQARAIGWRLGIDY